MKRIAVLTWFNRGRNYGQTLQAFALNEVLRCMGHQCTFLSYGKNGPRLTEEEISGLTGDVQQLQREFTRFIKAHIDYSPRLREPEEVRMYLQQGGFDVVLCGSDQIWNFSLSSFEPLYMFDFPLPCPKVAYAPGMMDEREFSGTGKFTSMGSWLEDFAAVSVREQSGRTIVKQITNGKVHPEVVLDPTLLLTRDEWLEKVSLPEVESKNYLFCYMFDMNLAQRNLVQHFVKEKNCDIVVYVDALRRGVPSFEGLDCKQVRVVSIEMFLSLIFHAKAVVTDSFHGTVFSLLFERDFFALENPSGGPERNLNRIVTLLEKSSLPQRLICLGNEEKAPWAEHIDYAAVDAQLALERKQSLGWLRSAVGKYFS